MNQEFDGSVFFYKPTLEVTLIIGYKAQKDFEFDESIQS